MSYSIIQPTLENIIVKTRRYAAIPSVQQYSDQEVVDAINTYYLWNLPSNLKLLSLTQTKSIFTLPDVDTYTFDTTQYFDIQPPVYISGYQAQYVQSKNEFYGEWPKLLQKSSVATGDNAQTSFSFTLSTAPVLRSSSTAMSTIADEFNVIITSQQSDGTSMTLVDVPTTPSTGVLYRDISGTFTATTGTINYITGAITADFPAAPGSGISVEAQVVPYVASRPQTVWFFQNQITLRPVPDDVYELTMNVMIKPTALIASGDFPLVEEWWTLLSMGAARVILQERLDKDQLAILDPFYREQLGLVENRTLTQLGNQRTATLFTSPYAYPFGLYNALQGGAS